MDKLIERVYTDPANPGAFGGADALYRAVHAKHPEISKKQVDNFLHTNRTYTLFKPRRLRFRRLRTVPYGFLSGIFNHFCNKIETIFSFTDLQADLADFQALAKHNAGNKYLLLAVDVLSRRFFGTPVKSKRPAHMIAAFDALFEQLPKHADGEPMLPKRIYTDRGLEFEARPMRAYFEEKGVEKLAAHSSKKAAVAERGIRTLKGRLYKWFSETNRLDWIHVLPQFLAAINTSRTRATGMRPDQIDQTNAREIWKRLYKTTTTPPKKKLLKEGDKVRIAEAKQVFDKGYFPNYSDHIYTVAKSHATDPQHYELKDHDGRPAKRRYYAPELQKTREDENTTWRVERVLRTRGAGEKKEFLVKFIGYDERYWIKQSDFVN